jgi:hypothetical protein
MSIMGHVWVPPEREPAMAETISGSISTRLGRERGRGFAFGVYA